MKKNPSFEDAMQELESSVSKLESGSLSLDDSLKEFENAVKLIKLCNDKISAAEQKVKLLIENSDGSVTDTAFPENNDAT